MATTRKKFSDEEKIRLLRLHLLEKEPVSDICQQYGLNPNVFYRWQKIFFEHGTAAFAQSGNGRRDSKVKKLQRQNDELKTRLASKDEIIAEIMASHVRLKKNLGQV